MADEIFMDVNAVTKMAGKFEQMNDSLKKASNAMQVTITMLKASSFVGLFGNYAMAQYLEQLKPQVDNYAAKCAELASDLKKSVEAYQKGDAAGAARFH